MAELADAQDLGSCTLRCGGSSPPSRTSLRFLSKATARRANIDRKGRLPRRSRPGGDGHEVVCLELINHIGVPRMKTDALAGHKVKGDENLYKNARRAF